MTPPFPLLSSVASKIGCPILLARVWREEPALSVVEGWAQRSDRLHCLTSRRVLDQQNLVPHLAVHQLVHDALRQQDAVSAGAHAQLVPMFDMGGGIVRSVRHRGVSDGVAAEARTWIAHVEDNGALGAHHCLL